MIGKFRSRTRRMYRRGEKQGSRIRVEFLERRDLLTTFSVTNTNNDGAGSLRQAILDANANGSSDVDVIDFSSLGSGVQTIVVPSGALGALPAVTTPTAINGTVTSAGVPQIVIDGASGDSGWDGLTIEGANSTVTGLSIVNFSGNGLVINETSGVVVTSSTFGVDPTATTDEGNGGVGIYIYKSSGNTIGGTTAALANVVGGNDGAAGIQIVGPTADNNVIRNLFVGTNSGGTVNLGNTGPGILINSGSNNSIGGTGTNERIIAANNGGAGVQILSGDGNSVRQSLLYSNTATNMILLEGDANDQIPSPVITNVTTASGATSSTITGTLTGAKANTTYIIEFFSSTSLGSSSQAQASTFLLNATVTTNSSGAATITASTTSALAAGTYVTATATESASPRNTSGLSNAFQNITSTNLVVDGSVTPTTSAQNGYVTWTYTVKNEGPLAASPTFTMTLPSTLSYIQTTSTQGTITRNGTLVTVALGSMAVDTTATIILTSVATGTGTISLTGTATAGEDTSTSDNSKTLSTTAVAGINLNVAAAALPNPGIKGQQLVIQYTVTNQGAAAATNAVVTGTLPAGVTVVSSSATQGTITTDSTANTFTANVGGLAIGASAVLRIVLSPTTTGTLTSTASATATEPEIFTGNNSATISVAVNDATPDPSITTAPTVTTLNRYGVHGKLTSVVVGFSLPIDAATAQNLSNYVLVAPGNDGVVGTKDDVKVRIRTATYDATNRRAILTTWKPLRLNLPYQLTIKGTQAGNVTGQNGLLLDGGYTGQPGSNFVRWFRAWGPGSIGAAQTHTKSKA